MIDWGAPSYLIFQVTSRCNSKCLTCFNWERIEDGDREDLSFNEIERISENYGRLLQLTLGGGEPFLREDIAEICRLFNCNNQVQHVTIPTNALLPEEVRKGVETILATCNLNYLRLGLSLDGVGHEHDRLRGVKGNYERLLETYRHLTHIKKRHPHLGIEISSVLSAFNRNTICDTIDTVRQLFPDIDKHAMVVVRGNARDPACKNVDAESYRTTVRRLKHARQLRRPAFIPRVFQTVFDMNTDIIYEQLKTGNLDVACLAGRRLIVITPHGEVYPCEELHQAMGNLRECGYQISAVLKSPKARAIKVFIRERGCACTFECALHASLIFNPRHYPRILRRMLSGT
jgi:MoaA/NifB/PqqE/SkfB family radical SAM enzyme